MHPTLIFVATTNEVRNVYTATRVEHEVNHINLNNNRGLIHDNDEHVAGDPDATFLQHQKSYAY
jgi:hypothetical protein